MFRREFEKVPTVIREKMLAQLEQKILSLHMYMTGATQYNTVDAFTLHMLCANICGIFDLAGQFNYEPSDNSSEEVSQDE